LKRKRCLTGPGRPRILTAFPQAGKTTTETGENHVIAPLMPTYNRADLSFARGEGAWLWTEDGRRFLDFGAGIATSSLGHGHPHLVAAIAEQAAKVMHVSNLYRVPQAERLAARHVEHSFADSVFFCNSGAEANEGMIKAVRRYHAQNGAPERFRMITFEGAFHGRTLATLAATGNAKYLEGFGPRVDGFDQVPFGNMNAVRAAIGPGTAGIMIEPVQGEGGVRPAELRFLRELRAACDEFGLLLALDEVQIGMGRSGKLWAHQWSGIEPDVISSAKGIGGGFPLGAILAKEHVAKHLVPGTHGTTYGGNPLACAAGNAVLDVILADGFLQAVDDAARLLWRGLLALAERHPAVIEDIRGAGLLLGIKLRPEVANTEAQAAGVAEGILTVAAGQNVLRLAPPLIVRQAEVDAALDLLDRVCRRITPSQLKTAAK
jgi:acetylornithine/N-succinyldiaminopimelate aminotransferase